MKLSELGKILLIGRELLMGEFTTEYLCQFAEVSTATLRRYLDQLRNMGCVILSERGQGGWVYRLHNANEVRERLCLWLDLERTRSLL